MLKDIFAIIQSLDCGPTNPIPLHEISKHLARRDVIISTETLIAYLHKLEEQKKIQLIWFDNDLLTGVILL